MTTSAPAKPAISTFERYLSVLVVERLEGVADGAVERLHLLTSGSAEFFRGLGYVDADRDAAPAFITATAQFTSLCGSRAIG